MARSEAEMVALLGVSVGWACGGLAHDEYSLAEASGTEVVFTPDSDQVEVAYAVTYDGDAADLGWVVPVPGPVDTVEDGDPELFEQLRQATDPRVTVEAADSGGGGGGCLCGGGGSKGSDGGTLDGRGVTVISQGFTGTYEYVVIAATEVAALETWFADHGWVALATEALDHYVALGAQFVAIRVVPDQATAEGERSLPPVAITYDGSAMMWPAVMLAHEPIDEHHTTVYVRADTRATLSAGWSVADAEDLVGTVDDDALTLWQEYLRAEGGFVRTAAKTIYGAEGEPDVFVTRFDAIAPREAHAQDAEFALEDSEEWIETSIYLSRSEPPAAAFLILPLAGLGALGRRRRS